MSDGLWSTEDFLTAVKGRLVGTAPPALGGVSIDSRTLNPGDAFFAIVGDALDGHDYVLAALEKGAGLAVVAEERIGAIDKANGALVAVADTLTAMEDLGRAARARAAARIAAITGSVGKTSTKEALRAALERSGPVHASVRSFNNHWGVPLTLSQMPADAAFGVFEIGMNHPGEITPLVKMVRPHVAVITTVAPVHLAYFNSVDEIARAKAEIFLGLEPGGVAVLNRDNEHFDLLAGLARDAGVGRVVSFGTHDGAEARAEKIVPHDSCTCVAARILGRDVTFKIGAPGRHLVGNALAVLAAVDLLGGNLALAALALGTYTPPSGRGQRHDLRLRDGTALLIDDSYNANPASMRAAIALLGAAEPAGRGRRVAVLGDMLELGETSRDLHAALAEPLAEAGVDRVHCAGPDMQALWQALPSGRRGAYAEVSADIESALLRDVMPGDVIMIKGSAGSRMTPLAEALRKRFPPRQAVNQT